MWNDILVEIYKTRNQPSNIYAVGGKYYNYNKKKNK